MAEKPTYEELEQRVKELEKDLFKRNEEEKPVQDGEEHYRHMVEGVKNVGVLVAQDAKLVFANSAISDFLGYSKNELLSNPDPFEYIHPDDRKLVFEHYMKKIRGEEAPENYPYRVITRDGSIKWVEVTGVGINWEGRPGTLNFFIDITERKRIEEALWESEERYRTLVENVHIGIYRCTPGPKGNFLTANQALLTMFGFDSEEELKGINVSDLYMAPSEREKFSENLLAEERVTGVELRLKKRDGSPIWGSITGRVVYDMKGEVAYFDCTIEDITERKRAEDERRESEERYHTLFTSVSDLIMIHDLEGRLLNVNPAVSRLSGFTSEELVGRPISDFINPKFRHLFRDQYLKQIRKQEYSEGVVMFQAKDGTDHYVEYSNVLVQQEGKEPYVNGSGRDITERLRAERELRESEERYRDLFENANDMIQAVKPDGSFAYTNRAWRETLGYSEEEISGLSVFDIIDPADKEHCIATFQRVMSGKDAEKFEASFICKDGKRIIVDGNINCRFKYGEPISTRGIFRDITERKQAEEELRKSEGKYRYLTENMTDIVWTLDKDFRTTYVSPSIEKVLGFTPEERKQQTLEEMITQESVQKAQERFLEELRIDEEGSADPDRSVTMEVEYYHKDGSIVWMENRVKAMRDPSGVIVGMHGVSRNIIERKKAEEALRENEEKYRTLVEASFDGIFVQKGSKIVFANARLTEMLGYDEGELLGMDHWLVYHPDYQDLTRRRAKARMRGEAVASQYEVKLQRKEGSSFDCEVNAKAISYQGEPGVQVWIKDIEARKRAEEALQREKERFKILIEKSPFGISLIASDGHYIYINPKFSEIFGYTLENVPTGKEWFTKAYPDRKLRNEVISKWISDLKKSHIGESIPRNYVVKAKDGSEKLINFRLVTLGTGEQLVIYEDNTERKRLEEQLLQAQKMKAIGTLAGGIAHNFNNLLMGIQGYTSLMLLEIDSDNFFYESLKNIERLIRSGAKLTSQLLGYAREGRYEVKPINLNEVVEETSDTFGTARKDIIIYKELTQDLCGVKADKSQMEQILLNLYVNAADAMPRGGSLYLKTMNVTHAAIANKPYNVEPGNYVLMTIKDTGTGMDKETMERIFDPFFTTKGLAEGTGLGLASVYGILKSHGGYIDVESEIGYGSTFYVYLPALEEIVSKEISTNEKPVMGRGTILLVDDEDFVLDAGAQIIKAMGYRVLQAKSGPEGVEVYKKNKDIIDLVILDMVMPEMGGGAVYEKLKEENPLVKVLLSSGYNINGQAKEIMLRGCNGFIQKPFNIEDLSQAVRRILYEK